MLKEFVRYKNSKIHYISFGSGEKVLIAFHGFGENAKSFLSLEPSLGKKYTVYSFDIPYHGDTQWKEKNVFTQSDLVQFISDFITSLNIVQFSVLGFSMGGKCAMAVAKHFTDRIDTLILMASDGIRTRRLYNIAVYPRWGKDVFKIIISRPGGFFTFMHIMHASKLISPWLYKFTLNHMDTKEKRQRLYDTWLAMANFKVDINKLKERLNAYDVRTFLFFGERDEVIPVSVGEYFASGLKNCQLVRLNRGHYFIDEKLNDELLKVLI